MNLSLSSPKTTKHKWLRVQIGFTAQAGFKSSAARIPTKNEKPLNWILAGLSGQLDRQKQQDLIKT
jgi:hypothetical protein